MADSKDPKDLVTTIMQDTDIAILTHVDAAGRLGSMPMGTQDFVDPVMVHRSASRQDARESGSVPQVGNARVAGAPSAGLDADASTDVGKG